MTPKQGQRSKSDVLPESPCASSRKSPERSKKEPNRNPLPKKTPLQIRIFQPGKVHPDGEFHVIAEKKGRTILSFRCRTAEEKATWKDKVLKIVPNEFDPVFFDEP